MGMSNIEGLLLWPCMFQYSRLLLRQACATARIFTRMPVGYIVQHFPRALLLLSLVQALGVFAYCMPSLSFKSIA